MRLPPFPERLLRALSPAGERYGLLLAGGHALRAHGFTDRLVEEVELVTAGESPLPAVADAAAAAQEFSFRDLERLAAAHLDDFSPRELLMRLEFVELMSDERFEAHGLDERHIVDIRAVAREWAEDIKLRRADDGDADYDDPDLPEVD
ncbi:hypothetical protein [Nonomuraea sp. NPDC052265]|uniref:hypothetical protein n=1 Tax=Nonomuraea sp. NPDC052265 TaxID=3364374 RepID=UPI0037C9BA57